MKKFLNNTRGDTIVEVIIVITIVGFLLAAAFTTLTSGTKQTRTSQERAEALKLAESQIEGIRKFATDEEYSDAFFADVDGGNAFCVEETASEYYLDFISNPPDDSQNDTFANYPLLCKGIRSLYNTFSTYDNTAGTFTTQVRWDGLTTPKNQVTLHYKISDIPTPWPPPSGDGNPDAEIGGVQGNGGNNKGPLWRHTIQITVADPSPGASLATCTLNWGDGTLETVPLNRCNTGERFTHTYPGAPSNPPDEPGTYECVRYLIVFTVVDTVGRTETFRTPRYVPRPHKYCTPETRP